MKLGEIDSVNFFLKIWRCKILDKFHVWGGRIQILAKELDLCSTSGFPLSWTHKLLSGFCNIMCNYWGWLSFFFLGNMIASICCRSYERKWVLFDPGKEYYQSLIWSWKRNWRRRNLCGQRGARFTKVKPYCVRHNRYSLNM